jgi:exodeoxyribonuclease V alpha subunit
MQDDSVTIRGNIVKVFYAGPKFTAGLLETKGQYIRFAGPFAMAEDDAVVFEGRYEKTRWGPQLKVAKYKPDLQLDAFGLMRFLATSKRFKGIGDVRARELVRRFGDNFDTVVMETPHRLLEVRGITPEVADGLREEWMRRRQQAHAIAFLAAFGLTPYQVDKLLEVFGDSAVRVVKENPYVLMEKVDGFGFRRADDVALKTGVARDNTHRIRAGLLYVMQKASEDGHTCTPRTDLQRQAVEMLMLDSDNAFRLVEDSLANLLSERELIEFSGSDGRPHLAIASLHRMETYVAGIFARWGGRHGST